MRAPSLSLRHVSGECLPPRPPTCRVLCLCNGSRHEAPTGRASLRLLHSARQRQTQGAWLVSAWDTLSAECFAFATEAAMKLRLIEQACGCSTV